MVLCLSPYTYHVSLFCLFIKAPHIHRSIHVPSSLLPRCISPRVLPLVMSRKKDDKSQYLLDDSSSSGPSDEYIAYTSGDDVASSTAATTRRKYIIAGVITAAVALLLVLIVGYAMYKKGEPDSPDGSVPALADSYRLPSNVIPSRYELLLRVDLDRFEFGGVVTAHARIVNNSMPAFVMHAMGLNISNVTVHVNGSQVAPSQYKYYLYRQDELVGTQYLVIQGLDAYEFPVTDSLAVTVHFYRALPTTSANGLYATSYQNNQGQTVWVAATQFEPTHARRAFPCFDELNMKAVFKVALEVKTGLVALSNGKWGAATNLGDGFTRQEFDSTAIQSSYLMAFAVCDFDYINATLVGVSQQPSYPFRVWGEKGRIQAEGQELANRGFKVQEWFASYFDQKFPLAKQDQIGVPNKGGAMENYGLVTYAYYGIYVNEWTTSVTFQSGVSVNAHELAHMLWGDLFTPLWWSDTWTKEGSARFWR